MKELFERWAELEPERCRKDFGGYLIMFEGHFHHISTKRDGSLGYSFDSMTIEYALREAIEANEKTGRINYRCYRLFPEDDHYTHEWGLVVMNPFMKHCGGAGKVSVEALLTTYIKALEGWK